MTPKTHAWMTGFCLALVLFLDSVMLWTFIVFHLRLPFGFKLGALMLAWTTWQLYRDLRKRISVGLKN